VGSSKHWNQKYRKLRSEKVIYVDLPDYNESKKTYFEMSKEEIRSKMKEKGVLPPQPWIERPLYLGTTGQIIEPYVPPEGDGKISFVTKEGVKQKFTWAGKKGQNVWAMRILRKFDDDFEVEDFLVEAQDVYMKAHTAMMNVRKDEQELELYVTERVFPEMLHNAKDKTIHWKMIGLLEQPRLVQARTQDLVHKENIFCQLTVRFHTQQILAVYDRFGRLMYGSEILAKDVLEYVVFERHLSNKYGRWRIHGKIIPDWLPPKDPVPKTYRVLEQDPEEPPATPPAKEETSDTTQPQSSSSDSPQLAPA